MAQLPVSWLKLQPHGSNPKHKTQITAFAPTLRPKDPEGRSSVPLELLPLSLSGIPEHLTLLRIFKLPIDKLSRKQLTKATCRCLWYAKRVVVLQEWLTGSPNTLVRSNLPRSKFGIPSSMHVVHRRSEIQSSPV